MKTKIANWLDEVLAQEIPDEVVGFCFNLYDDGDDEWSMELVGTERFDEDDPDWPCDEVTDFETRDEPLEWTDKGDFEKQLNVVNKALSDYLSNGKYASVLKSKAGVGVGFVDGDIDILFKK